MLYQLSYASLLPDSTRMPIQARFVLPAGTIIYVITNGTKRATGSPARQIAYLQITVDQQLATPAGLMAGDSAECVRSSER